MPASPSDPPPLPRQHRPPRTPRSPRSPASASAPAPAGEAAIRILGGLAEPRPTRVEATAQGVPLRVEGRAVESIRETWQVEEGWWTASPVRRRYHEVVIAGARLLTLYEDLVAGTWHSQRGS